MQMRWPKKEIRQTLFGGLSLKTGHWGAFSPSSKYPSHESSKLLTSVTTPVKASLFDPSNPNPELALLNPPYTQIHDFQWSSLPFLPPISLNTMTRASQSTNRVEVTPLATPNGASLHDQEEQSINHLGKHSYCIAKLDVVGPVSNTVNPQIIHLLPDSVIRFLYLPSNQPNSPCSSGSFFVHTRSETSYDQLLTTTPFAYNFVAPDEFLPLSLLFRYPVLGTSLLMTTNPGRRRTPKQ
jgi:hypothetical protein